MIDPAHLRLALLVAVTIGYASVLGRMVATGAMFAFPAFWSYLFVALLKSATWIFPAAAPAWVPFEPLVVALKALAALEAFYWATRPLPFPDRWSLFVTSLGAASIAILVACQMPDADPARAWIRTRQIAHVGLGAFALSGCLLWWARTSDLRTRWGKYSPWAVDPRAGRHALILTAYLLAYAVAGAVPDHKTGADEAARWWLYWARGFAFRLPALACLWAWWRVMR